MFFYFAIKVSFSFVVTRMLIEQVTLMIEALLQIIFLGSIPISQKIREQQFVTRSSTEAKYHALVTATSEFLWIRALLNKLDQVSKPELFCDNIGAISNYV